MRLCRIEIKYFYILPAVPLLLCAIGCRAEIDAGLLADATAQKQEISIAWAKSDSSQVEVMNAYVMPALEEAFPDIQFSYTDILTDKAQALQTMSATGTLADIYCSDSYIYEILLEAGDFVDLTPYLEKDGWLEENYVNPKSLYNNGVIYTMSCGQNDFYTPVIYYNMDLFEKYGLKEPETMGDFLTVCRTLLDHAVYPMTINTTYATHFLMDALISSYDPQALNDLHARRCDWYDPRIQEALRVFDELKTMGAFAPDSATKEDTKCLEEFTDGTAAMWPTMSWFNYDVTEDQVGFRVGVFNWPSGNAKYATGYQQLNWGSVFGGWAVNPEAEDIELCIAVLKVLLKAEAQRHADNGMSENFIVPDAIPPTNPLEVERMEAYWNAGEYRTLLCITAMDSATVSVYTSCVGELLSDDLNYLSDDFIEAFSDAWVQNTRPAD